MVYNAQLTLFTDTPSSSHISTNWTTQFVYYYYYYYLYYYYILNHVNHSYNIIHSMCSSHFIINT